MIGIKCNQAIGFPIINAREVGKVSLLNGEREMLNNNREAQADTPLPQKARQGRPAAEYWSASVPAFYILPSCRKSLAAGNIVLKLLNNYRMWEKLTKIGFRLSGNNYSMEI